MGRKEGMEMQIAIEKIRIRIMKDYDMFKDMFQNLKERTLA